MKGNDNVKTAIRWRPKTAGQNVTIEKVTKNVNTHNIFDFFY